MSTLRVTFVQPDGVERQIDDITPGRTLMEVGRERGVAGILADCGGSCSCATCHVFVDPEWIDKVGPPNTIEEGVLDMVESAKPRGSRLSCQIELVPELDGLRVTVADNS
jgi:2Fe-2S ferredoxin